MEDVSATTAGVAIIGVAAVIFALTAIGRHLLLPLIRGARSVQRFLEDWNGHPPRHPGDDRGKGVPERLSELEKSVLSLGETVSQISVQVMPNGGSSLRDAVEDVRRNTPGTTPPPQPTPATIRAAEVA